MLRDQQLAAGYNHIEHRKMPDLTVVDAKPPAARLSLLAIPPNLATLSMILNGTVRLPFRLDDMLEMLAFFEYARRHSIDLEVAAETYEAVGGFNDGVVRLYSRSFGYAWALINLHAGEDFLGRNKSIIFPCTTHYGENAYTYSPPYKNLVGALRSIAKMYREAATKHLP